jgi:hypothetical protein
MFIDDLDVTPSFLNRCPDCNSTNVQPWDAKHSCPKCGEHMTEVGCDNIAAQA